jgi:quercetin dioxygenase-like cupin family protein
MVVKNIDTLSKIRVNMDGARNALRQNAIMKKDGASAFSFRVFTLEKNGHTPCHAHPFEHVNYVIKGSGCIVDKDGKETDLKQGDFTLISAMEKHQYVNKSETGQFVFICAVLSEYE